MVRRSLAMAAGEQYFRLAVSFVSLVLISRLLTPTEIGVSVIGLGIVAIALGLREFATSDCLIQRQEVTRDDIRASFTILFLLTVLITAAMFIAAPWFGTFYGEEKLARFLRVAAIAGLIETISLPIRGLLRRDLAFGAIALINTASAGVTAVATVVLAFVGFSYMSVAWATMAGAIITTVLSCCCRSDLSIFRPVFRSWCSVLAFGGYNGASYAVGHAYETIPQLVLGSLLPSSAVGLFNRATMVSKIPQMVFLTSVLSVAFPALAAEIRRGRSLKEPYLQGLGYVTVFYWPALALLALLAHPIVMLLLGQQWLDAVPLLQIMAIAYMASFPDPLTTPAFLAIGANRDRALVLFLGYAVSAGVLCGAAWLGITVMAASKLLTMPYMTAVALYFVRRHLAFSWRDVWAAVWKSAVVTVGSMAGPVCVLALSGWRLDLSIGAALVALVLALAGWLAGVLAIRHPVWLELRHAADAVAATSFVRRRWRLREPVIPKAGEAR